VVVDKCPSPLAYVLSLLMHFRCLLPLSIRLELGLCVSHLMGHEYLITKISEGRLMRSS
jgi:hypothetical protein